MPHSFAVGLFWVSVACCAVAQFYIIRSARGTEYVPSATASEPHSRRGVELMWAVLPALALALLMLFTWRAMQESRSTEPPAHGAQRVAAIT